MGQKNKAFKARHATKGQVKRRVAGRVSVVKKSTAHMSSAAGKAARKNERLQRMRSQREQIRSTLRGDRHLAPRVVMVVNMGGLKTAEEVVKVAHELIVTADPNATSRLTARSTFGEPFTVVASQHTTRLTFLSIPPGANNTTAILDAAKVADLVLGVVGGDDLEVDDEGYRVISLLRAQGLPSFLLSYLADGKGGGKPMAEKRRTLLRWQQTEVPSSRTPLPLKSRAHATQVVRLLCQRSLGRHPFRNSRPYMLVSEARIDNTTSELTLCGYLNGAPLHPDRLLHLPGIGSYRVRKLYALPDANTLHTHQKLAEPQLLLEADSSTQDSLIQLATPEIPPEMVREEDMEPAASRKKRSLPPGTSSYQAAWLDALSDDELVDSDEELDEDADDMTDESHGKLPAAAASSRSTHEKQEDEEDEEEDASEDEEMESWRVREDEERDFPDEVDTPRDVPAQVRFAKYHPLQPGQSWDPYQELPLEYARMFRFSSWERASKRAVQEGKTVYQLTAGGMDETKDEAFSSSADRPNASDWTGQYVALVLGGVPASAGKVINECWATGVPVVLGGLLRHERCISVIHIVLRRHPQFEEPIPAKTAMDLHCGFRRLPNAKPIFSEYSLRAPQCRYERFLHATGGRVTVATLYAPVAFDGTPVVALTSAADTPPDAPRQLIGTGHVLSADPERVVLKRIFLTGLPSRIGRSTVRVKGMFYRPEDVQFFKSVKLRTKLNLTGHILESVGTHGEMKCVFSAQPQSHDTVLMPLYKRIYPCWPPSLPESVEEVVLGGDELTPPVALRQQSTSAQLAVPASMASTSVTSPATLLL